MGLNIPRMMMMRASHNCMSEKPIESLHVWQCNVEPSEYVLAAGARGLPSLSPQHVLLEFLVLECPLVVGYR